MKTLIPLLAATLMLLAFYWFAVRPVLLELVGFKIFNLRDRLRRLAIDGHVSATSFPYRHLERTLCNLITLVPNIKLWDFAQFSVWKEAMPKRARDVRFTKVAPFKLRYMERKAVKALLAAVWINSPISGTAIVGLVAVAFVLAAVNLARKLWFAKIRLWAVQRSLALLEQDLETSDPLLAPA